MSDNWDNSRSLWGPTDPDPLPHPPTPDSAPHPPTADSAPHPPTADSAPPTPESVPPAPDSVPQPPSSPGEGYGDIVDSPVIPQFRTDSPAVPGSTDAPATGEQSPVWWAGTPSQSPVPGQTPVLDQQSTLGQQFVASTEGQPVPPAVPPTMSGHEYPAQYPPQWATNQGPAAEQYPYPQQAGSWQYPQQATPEQYAQQPVPGQQPPAAYPPTQQYGQEQPYSPTQPYPEGQSYPQAQPYPQGQYDPYQTGQQQPGLPLGAQDQPVYTQPMRQPYPPTQPYPSQGWGQQQPSMVAEKGSKTGLIVGIVIAVVVLALVGVGIWQLAAGGDPGSGPTSTRSPNPVYTPSGSSTPSSSSTPHSTAPAPQPTGTVDQTTVTVDIPDSGPVEYTITGDVEIIDTVGGSQKAAAGMVYYCVPVTVTYRGTNLLFYFKTDDIVLTSSDGVQHTPDLTAMIVSDPAVPDKNPLWMALLSPDESAEGLLIYEVDAKSTDHVVLTVGVSSDNPATVIIDM